jgi:hypothetical protein
MTTGATASSITTSIDGPAPERDIARDLAKKAVLAAPILVAVAALIWGWQGAASTLFAIALVTVNFLVAAAIITWTVRISIGLMLGAVLFGYLIRLGLILAILLLVKDAPWVDLVALCLMLIITQVGLLFWEIKYVAATLAFPGLKPTNPPTTKDGR